MRVIILVISLFTLVMASKKIPMVINTWAFTDATENAWVYLVKNLNALDAVEVGCSACERLQCDGTVGYGGSPDEEGETTLDAMIFDGTKMDMGAVGALRQVKSAISVARNVLEHTSHSFLVGNQASQFAHNMGFPIENLSTSKSRKIWKDWWGNQCQPNYWKNVEPDNTQACGPYKPISENSVYFKNNKVNNSVINEHNHDTIGMVAIDAYFRIVAGTSTNGMTHKIPGRVGDSPIPGAGAYADSTVGGAAATGDGDIMMRFLPSFVAVEEMRRGSDPTTAARTAINRIKKKYHDFFGAVIAVDRDGNFGAACNGMKEFKYSVANEEFGGVNLMSVVC